MVNYPRLMNWLCATAVATAQLACGAEADGGSAAPADAQAADVQAADAAAGDSLAETGESAKDASVAALPVPEGLQLLATASSSGVQAQLFAAQPLFTGINSVYYRLQDAQGVLMEGALSHQAQMAMAAPHACPVVQPVGGADVQALYAGLLIPHMPGDPGQPWKVRLDYTPPTGAPLQLEFAPVAVQAQPLVKVVKGTDGHSYVVALRLAAKAKLGKNPLTLSVHRASADELSYAAVTDASVKLTTLMVSMGHGSNGNVNPVAKSDGLYDGAVALTMPGDWRITFALTIGDAAVGSASFDLKL